MTDKHSSRTEDEILEQTFAGVDTQMTDFNTQSHDGKESGGAKAAVGAKKTSLSSNKILYIAGGIAVVGVVGYMGLKTMLVQPPPMQAQQIAAAPIEPIVAPAEPIVALADPGAIIDGGQQQLPQIVIPGTDNAVLNHLAANIGMDNQVQAIPNIAGAVDAAIQNQGAVVDATATAAATAASAVVAGAAASLNQIQVGGVATAATVPVVDDLKAMFEQQTREFRSILTANDTRISTVEGAIGKQENINRDFRNRLTALENRRQVTARPASQAQRPCTERSTQAPVANRDAQRDSGAASVATTSRVTGNEREQVLIDNREHRQPQPVQAEASRSEANLTQFRVHSIFNGRIWLRNADSSLSTFAVGDRLPTGEVIKEIDSRTFEVTTDRRKFGKQ